MTVEKLNSSDYRFLREMLDTEVGILLEDGKEYLAVTRLETVMWDYELPNLATLVTRLRKNDKKLKASVIDAMTVNETLFFRDPNVWNALRETLLPQIIEAKHDTRILRCWSAASSSGQEPYSLGIVISELLGKEDASWDVQVLASDLSTEMVARTEEGVYSNYEVSRGMAEETRDRYFRARGDKWQVNDRLRARVETRQINLSAIPRDLGEFDLIMLRNVLIYFSADTRDGVLRKMATMLSPVGCVLLGASEGAVGVPNELVAERMSGLVAFHSREASKQVTVSQKLEARDEQATGSEVVEAQETGPSAKSQPAKRRSFLRGRSTSRKTAADFARSSSRSEARQPTNRRTADATRSTATRRGETSAQSTSERRAARSAASSSRTTGSSDKRPQRTTAKGLDLGSGGRVDRAASGSSRSRIAARSTDRTRSRTTVDRSDAGKSSANRSKAGRSKTGRSATGSDRVAARSEAASSLKRRKTDPAPARAKAAGEPSAIERLQALREQRESRT